MKRTAGERPAKAETIARKQALIRSLIELNGLADPSHKAATADRHAGVTLAPIIPFPVGGQVDLD